MLGGVITWCAPKVSLAPFLLHSLKYKILCNVAMYPSAAWKTTCVTFPVAFVCIFSDLTHKWGCVDFLRQPELHSMFSVMKQCWILHSAIAAQEEGRLEAWCFFFQDPARMLTQVSQSIVQLLVNDCNMVASRFCHWLFFFFTTLFLFWMPFYVWTSIILE